MDLSEVILDVARSAIFVIDMEGHVVRWNQAAAALTGISSDRIRGHVFHETLPFPRDIDKWKLEFDRISAGLAPRYFETHWRIHDDSLLPLTCSCSLIRDPAGSSEYIVCTVIDTAATIESAATRTVRASLSREFMTDRTAQSRDISRFLHDTISQDLVALSFNVSKFETVAGSALELIDRCCRDIRVISYMLAPPSLHETTLEESIEHYAGYVREETGLAIAVDIDPVPETVSPEAQLLFFAAVQEWAARGIRSSAKAKLSVRLRNSSAGTVLELETVCVAPPSHVTSPRAGWAIIRERARALGGEFDIGEDSARVFVRISLPGSSVS